MHAYFPSLISIRGIALHHYKIQPSPDEFLTSLTGERDSTCTDLVIIWIACQ